MGLLGGLNEMLMKSTVPGTLQACNNYILSAPISFSRPTRASRGTFSLKGHLHKMVVSNSASQLGTASKERSRKCVVVEEGIIQPREQYAVLASLMWKHGGYVRSSVRMT